MTVSETPRLRLRRVRSADAPFVLELLTDPDFLANVGDRDVHSLRDAHRYITTGLAASYRRHGFGLWLVELKSVALAIGLCGLLRRDTHPDVEIGFALLPRFRHRGYALEAAQAALRLGTQEFGLKRIVAITAPGNRDSIRILETLGLKFERLVRFTPDGSESRLYVLEHARRHA
jgi:ribosomal-protein-alanine N-acetyltransferase